MKPASETENLLVRNGYRILSRDKKRPLLIKADGQSHLSEITAELLVEKEKAGYAVLSGPVLDPTDTVLRRRLTETAFVFKTPHLLYVDLENHKIHKIGLELPRPESEAFLLYLVALFIILIIAGIIWLLIQLKLV
ncbi:hypothetical protein HZC35_03215 [Candidatus Saganbacteria bacterium]|nr:hypothetical protein [Candidatus Saganbacteria bacterium]